MSKSILLFALLPFLALIACVYLYKHDGKRQFLNFDIIQFIYSFVIMPVMFVWLKSFLFFILKSELGTSLSINQFFLIDTAFSLLFIFVSSFVVIHSLTKSFALQRKKDPLLDIFELSEYFHLSLSHSVIFIGTLLIVTLISVVNLNVPIGNIVQTGRFYLSIPIGIIAGIMFSLGVFNYDPSRQFFRVMKLLYGLMFLFHAAIYFLVEPSFSAMFAMYWIMFVASATLVILGVFAEPGDEESAWWQPFTLQPKKALYTLQHIKNVVTTIRK